ncbi:transcriptional regulator, IclR family [Saccharopolyspora kobensis]|uniref:Glycerol operon regulatory protein n=1 Tax=Saccharopolyspora kobensis TaxID=146035 RepID=A0A1H6C8B2_9PSEU|nr:IclR family transcriptional regulator [Saccharopolyspora kobensis]SEG68997.1 transcriptional regulator, IclR family [Saccharopolyspora kobensis]SFC31459.1 transcriptional regulator, IclR family [Saccharopolyspora kobensis]
MQSVDRAVTVLELLARNGEAGITEIAGELGVHKSTASRLVSVLEARGLVEQLGERGKYAIGFGIVRLAGAATERMDLPRLGRPFCESLAADLGETVNIAIRDYDVAINISQARGTAAVTAHNWVGQRTPLHATSSGKVLFAHAPHEDQDELLARPLERYTTRTVTSAGQLRKDFELIVRDGYATSYEELELGLNAAAVAVYNQEGEVIAALSASGPSYRFSRKRMREVVGAMRIAAKELSSQLGFLV